MEAGQAHSEHRQGGGAAQGEHTTISYQGWLASGRPTLLSLNHGSNGDISDPYIIT